MPIKWVKAIIAGIIGTIVFDIVGLVLTRHWWDIPMLLGEKIGGGIGVGVVAHYVNGVLIAIIYAGIAPSLWGADWLRALLFMTAQTVFGVGLFMMPLLGMGIFGMKAGPAMPVVGMMRHWAYGLILAFLYPVVKLGPTPGEGGMSSSITRHSSSRG